MRFLKRLSGKTVPISAIHPRDRRRMHQIMDKYYANVTKEDFERDLAAKDHVIVMRHPATGMIEGFSTLKRLEILLPGTRTPVRAVFSGDTIIERNFWGQQVLKQRFLAYMLKEKLRRPFTPLYWLLISKGYKTYLLMANNFPEHYPRYERSTPQRAKAILDGAYEQLFPQRYDGNVGLIVPRPEDCHLRQGVAYPNADLRQRFPRIRFFESANPNWDAGAELCCLARVGFDLPIFYFYRLGLKVLLTIPKRLFRRQSQRSENIAKDIAIESLKAAGSGSL